MRIVRIMNNNGVIAKDENGKEVVLLGSGIAFQQKPDQLVNKNKIEKKFVLESNNEIQYLEELFRSIPQSYIKVTNQIVDMAKIVLETDFKEDSLFISLVDHINFAIERKESGEFIENPLLTEISKFYPSEYKVGVKALDFINKETEVRLDDAEAGFIAFNIINATLKTSSTSAKEITETVKSLITIIESHYNLKLEETSVYYIRFITHLKYFLYRISTNVTAKEGNDEYLYRIVKRKYKNEFECAKKIKDYLEINYNYSVSNEEMGYLMIHINSMILHNDQGNNDELQK